MKLAGGAKVTARKGVVVAVEEPEANKLLGGAIEVRGPPQRQSMARVATGLFSRLG